MSPNRVTSVGVWAVLVLGLASVNLSCAQAPEETLDVLFVGNSYVYYNDMPSMVEDMTSEWPLPVRTESLTPGGWTLMRHLESGGVNEALRSAQEGGRPFDIVILQEQSALGVGFDDDGRIGEPVGFYAAVGRLVEMIREYDATPMLYMTWGKERFPEQIVSLAAAYDRMGADHDVPVAPAGLVWDRVRSERADLQLFNPDGSHPAETGSFLVAAVLSAQIAEATFTPMRITTDSGVRGLSDEDKEYLWRVAQEAVEERLSEASTTR